LRCAPRWVTFGRRGKERETAVTTPEAGWYVNPSGPGRRYWDGERWTEHIDDGPAAPYTSASASAPPPAAGPPPPPSPGGYPPPGAYVQQPPQPVYVAQPQGTSALVVCGYVFAVLMPIVGLVLGIVAATKQSEPQTSRNGIFVIVLSVVAFIVWFAIFSANRDTYPY
jgi:hypothetical protein